jgi:kanamycin kinase
VLSGRPRSAVRVPSAVEDAAAGEPVRPVWKNELGGLTFEVGIGSERRFIKWAPMGSGLDLKAEAVRLEWAGVFTRVPTVIDKGFDKEGTWMVTTAVPGENAVTDRWKADPPTAVRAIGQGLRAMHDALPVGACPFSWSAEDRIANAHRLAASGSLSPARWHAVHEPLDVVRALELLSDTPDIDEFVVCHGDACAPNTLLTGDGAFSGHVDLGALGVADRWADLAVATWSAELNFGPGWEGLLLDSYGIAPDARRIRYYRLLWDLDP